jgi:hypothetical protein
VTVLARLLLLLVALRASAGQAIGRSAGALRIEPDVHYDHWIVAATPIPRFKFGIRSAEFKLLSSDGSAVIGRARLAIVQQTPEQNLVRVNYQFTNGEYDIDEDAVQLRPNNNVSTLIKYKHSFFHPNGSLERVDEADLMSGIASCVQYLNGHPKAQKAKLSFPPDTYAGPIMIVPVRDLIQSGSRETGAFHYFSCIPKPKIYRIVITVQRRVHWSLYSGELDKADLQVDLGWLGFVISRALPRTQLWFDPANHLSLVGAKSYSYYRALEFIMVRYPADPNG